MHLVGEVRRLPYGGQHSPRALEQVEGRREGHRRAGRWAALRLTWASGARRRPSRSTRLRSCDGDLDEAPSARGREMIQRVSMRPWAARRSSIGISSYAACGRDRAGSDSAVRNVVVAGQVDRVPLDAVHSRWDQKHQLPPTASDRPCATTGRGFPSIRARVARSNVAPRHAAR